MWYNKQLSSLESFLINNTCESSFFNLVLNHFKINRLISNLVNYYHNNLKKKKKPTTLVWPEIAIEITSVTVFCNPLPQPRTWKLLCYVLKHALVAGPRVPNMKRWLTFPGIWRSSPRIFHIVGSPVIPPNLRRLTEIHGEVQEQALAPLKVPGVAKLLQGASQYGDAPGLSWATYSGTGQQYSSFGLAKFHWLFLLLQCWVSHSQ